MNELDRLYSLAMAMNDANFAAILAFTKWYGMATSNVTLPESAYQEVYLAIGNLHMAASTLTTALITYSASTKSQG